MHNNLTLGKTHKNIKRHNCDYAISIPYEQKSLTGKYIRLQQRSIIILLLHYVKTIIRLICQIQYLNIK